MNLFLYYSYTANRFSFFFIALACCLSAASCSAQKQIAKSAAATILDDTLFQTAHIGISVYDAAANKFLYNHQGEHNFIPASNTKIITCYAAMKYLGDSLEGMRVFNDDGAVYIFPTGDPTFLHKDFSQQPVFSYLKQLNKTLTLVDTVWHENPLGMGWSWDDYNDDYMIERSSLPLYGNIVELSGKKDSLHIIPLLHMAFDFSNKENGYLLKATREKDMNRFSLEFKGGAEKILNVPFITSGGATNIQLLADTLHQKIFPSGDFIPLKPNDSRITIIHSQPTDSLLKIMMHRSDNFFAEQSLLMVSNKLLGAMNDEKIIDTLLETDFKEMPQPPRWVDGSGLSRYNLFSPQDFVFVLNKMRNEFSWQRITTIFPTGGSGTLGNRYKHLEGKIFAKTGSLSNNATFSGYLITQSGKTLIFSIMVNNYIAEGSKLRNDMMQFLTKLYERY